MILVSRLAGHTAVRCLLGSKHVGFTRIRWEPLRCFMNIISPHYCMACVTLAHHLGLAIHENIISLPWFVKKTSSITPLLTMTPETRCFPKEMCRKVHIFAEGALFLNQSYLTLGLNICVMNICICMSSF